MEKGIYPNKVIASNIAIHHPCKNTMMVYLLLLIQPVSIFESVRQMMKEVLDPHLITFLE